MASRTDRAEQDVARWNDWVSEPTPLNTGRLLDSLAPILKTTIDRISAPSSLGGARIPRPVIAGTVNNRALKILMPPKLKKLFNVGQPDKGFNPDMSAPYTYLKNNLYGKVHEDLAPYRDLIRLSGNLARKVTPLKDVESRMGDERGGRYVSSGEMADELGLSTDQVKLLRMHLGRQELVSSLGEGEQESRSAYNRALKYTYMELSPHDQALYELWIEGDKKDQDLKSTLNLSRRQLQDGKQRIRDRIHRNMGYFAAG